MSLVSHKKSLEYDKVWILIIEYSRIFDFSVLATKKNYETILTKYSRFDIRSLSYSWNFLWHINDISKNKTKRDISSIFLVFSEYMNFTTVNAATAIFASFELLGACPAFRRACWHVDVSTPSFGCHLNPILTRGADYTHPILVHTKFWKPQTRLYRQEIN